MKRIVMLLMLSITAYPTKTEQTFNTLSDLDTAVTKRLEDVWKVFSINPFTEYYLNTIPASSPDYAYKSMQAEVKKGTALSDGEKLSIQKRSLKAQAALKSFLGNNLNGEVKIGCAFSGGGYRAMIATAGFMEGLQNIGLLDSIYCISTLSGSTWYLGPWMFEKTQKPVIRIRGAFSGGTSGITPSEFNKSIAAKIDRNHFNIAAPKDITDDFSFSIYNNDVLWPKILFQAPVTSVDVYGGILAHYLLAQKGNERQKQRLSSQSVLAKTGTVPWPIYTAAGVRQGARPNQFDYDWYEFNPEEVRNLEIDNYMPSWAFGRKFSKGKAQNFAPEQSFGYLMGIFGSAYTIDAAKMKGFISSGMDNDSAKKESSLWDKFKGNLNEIGDIVKTLVAKGDIKQAFNDAKSFAGKKIFEVWEASGEFKLDVGSTRLQIPRRISAAQVPNPFRDMTGYDKSLAQFSLLNLVDAGLAYNVPVRPLFRPERQLDIIIIGDASGNVVDQDNGDDSELVLGLKDVERFYGIRYKKTLDEKTFKVFEPQTTYRQGMKAPLVIYFDYMKDDALIKAVQGGTLQQAKSLYTNAELVSFDPKQCVKESVCNTFNFDYKAKDFKQLSGIAQFNVIANKDKLKEQIVKHLQKNNKLQAKS